MAILWAVLKVLLWILLGLFAIVLILLFLPVTADIVYHKQTGFSLRVGAFALRFRLFPARPKSEKRIKRRQKKAVKKAAKETKRTQKTEFAAKTEHTVKAEHMAEAEHTATAGQPKKARRKAKSAAPKPVHTMTLDEITRPDSPPKKLEFSLEVLKKLLPIAGTSMRRILWALRIHHIRIVFPVHAGDAAQTAITVGRINAVLGTGFAVLQNYLRLSFKETNIWPDYTGENQDQAFFSCKITAQMYIMLIVIIWALLQLRKEKIL